MAWWQEPAYTPDGDRPFDVGGTTLAAIRSLEAGTPAVDAGPADERACGNGSLMRILPLALAERDLDEATAIEFDRLRIEGRAMHLPDAVEYALRQAE